ncbi:MAG: methionyl-tRNA formyltransferase [Polyangiaceae bacterium]|jgi:methionyl-tRNA formyltransferase|nr:methionyl-tRNA formyltransferase [Polyangiaceae bacterium]
MRAVFFGTPQIAVSALRALTQVAEVAAVVCQPDRPSGRGLKLAAPPVKEAALELGLSVHQPTKVRTGELATWLREKNADVALVMAYGRILPADVLNAPRRGAMNLHASLLPRYRGAAPINWVIVHGETKTGISLMQMDEGLDTGPVYSRHELDLTDVETGGSLAERMATLAAHVVRADLAAAVDGKLRAEPQDESLATHAPLIERQHLQVDWGRSAQQIARLIRGMAPRPGAFTLLAGKVLRLHEARPTPGPMAPGAAPGTVSILGKRALVATGEGTLELVNAQVEGKKALMAVDLINGRVLAEGLVLGV